MKNEASYQIAEATLKEQRLKFLDTADGLIAILSQGLDPEVTGCEEEKCVGFMT